MNLDKTTMQRYETWKNDPYFDEDTRKELESIAGNEKEIEDRFFSGINLWNRWASRSF